MKFLKPQSEPEEGEHKQELVVTRLLSVHIQCMYCSEWNMMEGGPTGDNKKAKFVCPSCNKINEIAWNIDI